MSVSHNQQTCAERIAFVTTSYPSDDDGGAGHFVEAEVRRALAQGHAVTVFAPSARRRQNSHFAPVVGLAHLGAFGAPGALWRLHWRPDRWLGVVVFVVTARWAIRRRGPFDRTVAHFLLPSFWPICSYLTLPIEVVVHGSDLRLLESLPRLIRTIILRRLASRGRSIRCVSDDLARRIKRQLGAFYQVPIRVEPSPIDIPELPNKPELRKRLAIGSETLVVIASRLVKSKRVDVALKTAVALPNAKVVVCGDGPEYRRLSQQFAQARFLGQLPRRQVLEWMRASDLVISASREEGAPTVIREARALGTPVVTTAAGDLVKWAETDSGIRVVR